MKGDVTKYIRLPLNQGLGEVVDRQPCPRLLLEK